LIHTIVTYYTINTWSHLSYTHCVLKSVLQLAINI
ncbi:Os02g0141201, partial [Oryza sativa Japonica Group]